MPGGQPARLHHLFQPPGFHWSISALERLYSEAQVRALLWSVTDNADNRRDEDLLCGNLTVAWAARPIVGFKSYFWWDLVLHNERYDRLFVQALGHDASGVIRVYAHWGPLLFRPVQLIQAAADAVERLLRIGPAAMGLEGGLESRAGTGRAGGGEVGEEGDGRLVVGVHARMLGNWFDAHADPADRNKSLHLPLYVAKCAIATLPPVHRTRPVSYLVVSDRAAAKSEIRYILADAESEGQAERRRLNLTLPGDLDRLAGATGGRMRLSTQELHLLQQLGVSVYDYASGSRIITLGADAGRSSVLDMQMALAEVYALGRTDQLVRSSGSTFVTAAYAHTPKPVWYVIYREGTCQRQESSEPIAFGESPAVLSTIASSTSCFRPKLMLNFAWVFTST